MTDTQLLRHLAALMGWEVVGPKLESVDRAPNKVYADMDGHYWRLTNERDRWVEWRPLHSMDDAMMLLWRLRELGCGTMTVCLPDDAQPTVAIWLSSPDANGNYTPDAHGNFARTAIADMPQRAICLAALKTREEKECGD